MALDFEADASGTPFTGASAVADESFVPLGLRLSSLASGACSGGTSDGHAYAVLDGSGDRVLAPAPQARHNECDGGILRLEFPSPVGQVSMLVEADGVGGGFELRALDAADHEVAVQKVYDELSNCRLHPVLQPFTLELDHHGIAAIEARGLVADPLDAQVLWTIRGLQVRFDSFHPIDPGPVATPTAGPPPPTATPTATPVPAAPALPPDLYAGQTQVLVGGLLTPGSRVEVRTQAGAVLGAGTVDESGHASVWLLRALQAGESVLAIDLRSGRTSGVVRVGDQLVPAVSTGFALGVLLILGLLTLRLRRRRIVGAVLLLAAAWAARSQAAEELTAHDAATFIQWSPTVLASIGVQVVDQSPTAASPANGPEHFVPGQAHMAGFTALPEPRLRLVVEHGVFRGLGGGLLRHRGGFTLRWHGGGASLQGFLLRPAPAPNLLGLSAADGATLFVADNAHVAFLPDSRQLFLLDLDLRIAPALAERLGRPELSGLAVAALNVRARTDPLAEPRLRAAVCSPNFGPDIDIQLTDILQLQAWARSGGLVSMSPSTHIANVGLDDVPWYWAIAPSPQFAPQVGQHPYLYFTFYRLQNGVFRQIGHSDIKHAFYATNEPAACPCQGGQVLFARAGACGDTYSTTNNREQTYFGPRDELTPSTRGLALVRVAF